jgi:hypothetical protein
MSNVAKTSKAFCVIAMAAAGISGLPACSAATDTRNEEPAAGEQLQSTEQELVVPSTCHWSHEDTIVEPATGKPCGLYNACTGEQTGCHGNGYTYISRWITCPVGCCMVGCGL